MRNRRVGLITAILRAANTLDTQEMKACRKQKATEKYDANVRKKAKKASLRDYAEEINVNSLVNDVGAFQVQLAACGNSGKARITFLKTNFMLGSLARTLGSTRPLDLNTGRNTGN